MFVPALGTSAFILAWLARSRRDSDQPGFVQKCDYLPYLCKVVASSVFWDAW